MNEDNKRPLIIIGFMAAGKSTAAVMLCHEFDLEPHDTDLLIQKRLGRSIEEIFASSSEAYFRAVEYEVFAELMSVASNRRKVIASGGGLPLNQASQGLLPMGEVVFLNTAWHTILERLSALRSNRPLAAALNDQQLHELWQKRCEKYEEVADYVVSDYDGLRQCVSTILTPGKR